MKAPALTPHEYTANYLYADDGLKPFFACDSRVKDGDGSQVGQFAVDGERWVCRLSYQSSNIVNPGETTPAGTPFRIETVREFRLFVARHPEEDPLATEDDEGEQSFVAHLAPRWPGMQGEKTDGSTTDIFVPDGFGEGVNVRVNGSNIDFERYADLLALGFGAVDVSANYFRDYHQSSNIQDAELYVRLHADESGPVHARDGPIASLAHLLENDRDGRRDLKQWDTDEDGRQLPGYYHTVTFAPRRISEAWPGHELPKEIKHYYAREAFSKSKDDALAHPKVGASYQVSRWSETLYVDDVDQLRDELTETVHSVLMEAGIDLAPKRGNGPYVEDAYYEPETMEVESVTSLDLTRIRHDQQSVVISYLADGGFSPVEWESLQTLVTDGGEVSPQDIADDHGRHVDSVRRALNRISEIVDREYGKVGLKSDYIAEMVHDAVTEAKESVRSAVSTGAKAIDAAKRGLSETMAKWVAWCERYGVDVTNRGDALRLDLGQLDRDADASPSFLVRQAFEVWTDAGQDPARFRTASVRYNGRSVKAFELLG
ncbi:ORF14 [Halogeometricum pleomorphic virus 1]|uniref:ORF14 n=1 Tax=Halogeometricum pleomorphic virus 1 TaxID=1156722 RepID=H9ABR5_9VIRU|nr:transcriptional regulator [Halogeometricum pleomorphic virus 1]AFD04035.1 ORF14 [Halogeometricum pleomorphic virus 1]